MNHGAQCWAYTTEISLSKLKLFSLFLFGLVGGHFKGRRPPNFDLAFDGKTVKDVRELNY